MNRLVTIFRRELFWEYCAKSANTRRNMTPGLAGFDCLLGQIFTPNPVNPAMTLRQ
jgi:hypothetical protein